jgi:hypothetical protein
MLFVALRIRQHRSLAHTRFFTVGSAKHRIRVTKPLNAFCGLGNKGCPVLFVERSIPSPMADLAVSVVAVLRATVAREIVSGRRVNGAA